MFALTNTLTLRTPDGEDMTMDEMPRQWGQHLPEPRPDGTGINHYVIKVKKENDKWVWRKGDKWITYDSIIGFQQSHHFEG
jgi:hypothetical protein